jgi:hypothetical protein
MYKILFIFIFSLINLHAVSLSKLQIAGDVNYEIEKPLKDGTNNSAEGESAHDVNVDLKLSYPLSKASEFVVRVDDDDKKDENGSAVELDLDQIFITYEQKNLSVQFGLQEITGPFFYEKNGDGLLVLKPIKTNIVAFSYYVNNTYSNADEVYQVALIGETPNFSYSAWYTVLEDSDYTSTGVSTTDANYAATAAQVSIFKGDDLFKIGLNYTILEPDDTTSRTLTGEQKQIVLFMNNEDKSVKYAIAYIETGEDGGNVAIDQTTDSEANYSLDEVGANDITNGKAYYLMISKDFGATRGITIQYFNGDGTTSAEETKFTYTSYLDKNLYYYASYDMWSKTSETDSEKVEIGFNIPF